MAYEFSKWERSVCETLEQHGWECVEAGIYRKTFAVRGGSPVTVCAGRFEAPDAGRALRMFVPCGRMNERQTADTWGGMGVFGYSTAVIGDYGVIWQYIGLSEDLDDVGRQMADDFLFWQSVRSPGDDPLALPTDPGLADAKTALLRHGFGIGVIGSCGWEWGGDGWHGDFVEADVAFWNMTSDDPRIARAMDMLTECRFRYGFYWFERGLWCYRCESGTSGISREPWPERTLAHRGEFHERTWLPFVRESHIMPEELDAVHAIVMDAVLAWAVFLCVPARLGDARMLLNDALNRMLLLDGDMMVALGRRNWRMIGTLLWLCDYPGFRRLEHC